MNTKLEVKIAKRSGVPYVQIPPEIVWELAEHLSRQHRMVVYSVSADGITVEFLQQDRAAAQATLDGWSAQQSASPAPEFVAEQV